jgi:hypothetical protein
MAALQISATAKLDSDRGPKLVVTCGMMFDLRFDLKTTVDYSEK